jgi:hypothetical protein
MARTAKSKTPRPKRQTQALTPQSLPTEEEIRIRAFTLYLQRGSNDGHDIDDWLEAERELVAATPFIG